MTNPCLDNLPRQMRRQLLASEHRRRKGGEWGEWEMLSFPLGTISNSGWPASISTAWRNKVFSVLSRTLDSGVIHLAISSLSGNRPSWREMQRIKNELAGEASTAVEVYPPQSEVVDAADMFHIWIVPEPLPFSLYDRRIGAVASPPR